MSTWRDIWRYGVIANRLYAEDEFIGEKAFLQLQETYDKPRKLFHDGRDGMIRYIMGEAYETKYNATKDDKYKNQALKQYKEAKKLFPVPHWKDVAENSYKRLNLDTDLQSFYAIKLVIDDKWGEIPDSSQVKFNDLLWYAFQKVYSFVYLNDFARYVCLSALSRGSSEWPLSLVDFRTVLELEIKQCFPNIIKEFDSVDRYSLNKTIEKLKNREIIREETQSAFNNIRIAGNIAAHELYADDKYKMGNVWQFIKVLEFFNEYRRNNIETLSEEIKAPLNQLNINEFCEELEKK